ncbi:MAG: DUF1893 domain-containing protein [Sphingobacteriia bacterium]|nr:DUF1893 domain-containing protein [Sphingobacteriia bacterium]
MRIFERYSIPYTYSVVTNKILNRAKTGMCPMEQAVEKINTPKTALIAIIAQLQALENKK